MEISVKVDETNEFCTGVTDGPNAVVNVAEKKLGNVAVVCLKQRVFNVTNEKIGIAGIHESWRNRESRTRLLIVRTVSNRWRRMLDEGNGLDLCSR